MADDKKKQGEVQGAVKDDALLGAAAQQDGGLAQKLVSEQEGESPDNPNYPDPEKGSSRKPGTKALAQQKVAEKLQEEQKKAAEEAEKNESRTMGMSKARKEAYEAFEAAGNK